MIVMVSRDIIMSTTSLCEPSIIELRRVAVQPRANSLLKALSGAKPCVFSPHHFMGCLLLDLHPAPPPPPPPPRPFLRRSTLNSSHTTQFSQLFSLPSPHLTQLTSLNSPH